MQSLLSHPEKRVAGVRQVLRAIARGGVQRVYLASDAAPRLVAQVRAAADEAGIPVEETASMEALGRLCRLQVDCAAAAVTDRPADGN